MSMQIQEYIDLAKHSTMRLGGKARFACTVHTVNDVEDAVRFAKEQSLAFKVIGHGSNIVWSGDFNGVLIINNLKGFVISNNILTVAAGEVWDDTVRRTVEAGYTGLEYLSLIPGTTGATPVQNVGAYGCEVGNSLISLDAYDTKIEKHVTLLPAECDFGYRSSRFNTYDKDRFIITSLRFGVSKAQPIPPFYTALEQYFTEKGLTSVTAKIVRDAVIAIRQSKLPDPAVTANCGSFFKNPIVAKEVLDRLISEHPTMPHWPVPEGYKLSGAWLIETAGLKGYTDEKTGMGTYAKQPLVLVNHSAKQATDLLQFKQFIVGAVEQKFGVTLQQEPELI